MITRSITIAAALSTLFASAQEIQTIEVGAKMPAISEVMLNCDDSREITLEQMEGESGTLVIFSCNTCPFVVGSQDSEGWENRYNAITDIAKEHGISTVLINSNEAKRDKGDGIADMKQRKEEQGFTAHYVLDRKSIVADAFGARTTPHVFLFDKNRVLVYTGAIDDNVSSAEGVKEAWLENAMNALTQGMEIDPSKTRHKGCSIKRVTASR